MLTRFVVVVLSLTPLLYRVPLSSGLTAITDATIGAGNMASGAVDSWFSNQSAATTTYGHIMWWDTQYVTSMSFLFYKRGAFDENIGHW